MHNHQRSRRNAARNQDLIDLLKVELAKTPNELGLRPVSTFEDHDYNVAKVGEGLRRVADLIMKTVPKEDPWQTGAGAPIIRDQLWPVTNRINGRNPITACEAQWVNGTYPAGIDGLKKFCAFAKNELKPRGCSGIETVAWRYDLQRILSDDAYVSEIIEVHQTLDRVDVFSNHLIDQAVCDPIRPTHANILPKEVFGTDNCSYAVNFRAGVMAMMAPIVAKRLQLNDVVHGFCGGAGLWQVAYDFVRNQADIDKGVALLTAYWNPILDVYAHVRCVHGLEVHGTEAAWDMATWNLTRQGFSNRPEWGLGFDRSHLIWQLLDYLQAMVDQGDQIYHLHFKSVRFDLTGRTGLMRGLQPLSEMTQGWQFHTIGEGQDHRRQPERLEEDSLVINRIGYHGNVSAENEQPDSNPEERMCVAITNINQALVTPGKLHLPDSAT